MSCDSPFPELPLKKNTVIHKARWVRMSPWNTRMGRDRWTWRSTGTARCEPLSQKQAAERNCFQGHPHPKNTCFCIYSQTPNSWKCNSTREEGRDEGILPPGEQEKRRETGRIMGRIQTGVVGFTAPGKNYQLIKIIWINIHLNTKTTR